MKNLNLALALSAALALGAARATPITGTINFDGEAKVNTGDLLTATSFTSISGVSVVPVESGNYVGTTGAPVTFTPFSFTASAVTPLWAFTVGSTSYWFNATGTIDVTQFSIKNAKFLNLSGSGMAYETGYCPTPGTWSITDTSTGGEMTFAFGADTTVPDSGSTVLLIGLGLAGVAVGMIARRHAKTV